MKNLLNLITLSVVLFSLSNCSVESIDNDSQQQSLIIETEESSLTCTDADPQARLVNNGSIAFDFVILSAGGNIIQIANVMPNTTTNWNSFSNGETLFSIVSSTTGISDMKILHTMGSCTEIDIIVDSNNHLVNTQPTQL